MSSLLAETVCLNGEMCCGCLCGVCMRVCSTSKSQHFRIGFLFLYILGVMCGLMFLFYGGKVIDPFKYFIGKD